MLFYLLNEVLPKQGTRLPLFSHNFHTPLGPPLAGRVGVAVKWDLKQAILEGSTMSEESSFRDLLRRVRAGDQEAARQLAERYEPDIRRAAHGPLNDLRLRNLLDSMDICQAVLTEFFVRAADGQFELTAPDELVKLFVTMARNEVLDESRRYKAGRRDHRRQVNDLSEHCLGGLADEGPTPSRIVSTRELIEEVSRRLSAEERDLLEQRALGHEWTTLAEQRGASAVTLRKKLTRALSRVVAEMGLLER
jgi:RNA polymerase sigma-70 factor (ECF subfamily)